MEEQDRDREGGREGWVKEREKEQEGIRAVQRGS